MSLRIVLNKGPLLGESTEKARPYTEPASCVVGSLLQNRMGTPPSRLALIPPYPAYGAFPILPSCYKRMTIPLSQSGQVEWLLLQQLYVGAGEAAELRDRVMEEWGTG